MARFLNPAGSKLQFSDGSSVTFEPGKAAEVPDRFAHEAERAGLLRIGEVPSGSTAQRPAGMLVGSVYFDATLGRPVWWDGSAWRDASGGAA